MINYFQQKSILNMFLKDVQHYFQVCFLENDFHLLSEIKLKIIFCEKKIIFQNSSC